MSKGHSTEGSKIPFISNLKKPACASKRDVLELATLRYVVLELVAESFEQDIYQEIQKVIVKAKDIYQEIQKVIVKANTV